MLLTLKKIKRNKNFNVKYFVNFYLSALKIFIAIFLISQILSLCKTSYKSQYSISEFSFVANLES